MSIILSLDNKITEENNMSTKIKNVVNSFAFDKVVALLESGNIVTPQVLDAWEFRLYEIMQKHNQKISQHHKFLVLKNQYFVDLGLVEKVSISTKYLANSQQTSLLKKQNKNE